MSRSILVTGSGGQIGTVLVKKLREKYGNDNVIATDLRELDLAGPQEILDVTDVARLEELIVKYKVDEVYHLAALLSSKGEQNINLTWKINFEAYKAILELAVKYKIDKVFFPSTIGIYGSTTPKQDTPQHSVFEPETIYGISKFTGELWSEYYRNRYNLDVRSLRFPGVISHEVIPSGGTTDFSVEMFYAALQTGHYQCYLEADTMLPMIYMDDTIKAIMDLMAAPEEDISLSLGYNLSGFSVTPLQLYNEIVKRIPGFTISYDPDDRQKIADSWSETIDDSRARSDWQWKPDYDLKNTVDVMLANIKVS